MPFCGSCGALIEAGEAFCGECGTPVAKPAGGGKNEEERLMRTMNKFAPSLAGPKSPSSSSLSSPSSSPAPKPTNSTTPTRASPLHSTPSSSASHSASPSHSIPSSSSTSHASSSSHASPSHSTPSSSSSSHASPSHSTPSSSSSYASPSHSTSSASHSSSSSAPSSQPSTPVKSSTPSTDNHSSHSSGGNDVVFVDDSPKCSFCQKAISGGAYEFQGKPYHEACWRCQGCNGNLNGVPFGLKDGRPWCKNCNFGRDKVTCPACGELVIEGSFTKALGNTYHSKCFNCSKCGGTIGQNSGGFYQLEGQIVCKNCK